MSLKFNTFRSDRYLRSHFVEGRFFLAEEATDLELEMIDLLRRTMQKAVGDVAIDNAFKVSRLSSNQLLIEPGTAWIKGLPFTLRSSSDQLVSGASLTLGTVPTGVTVTDSASGAGKILAFTTSSTPTDSYRIIISAQEEIITDVEDPFLKNANLTESTAQKIRILFKINILSDSAQTETPIPYTPDTGAYNTANMTNEIIISPTSGGNGELITITPISGSQQIDGRDLELTITNNSGLGGGRPIPSVSVDQQAFYNGKLIDSVGNEYHINAIFNDTISTRVIIRLDKEVGQPNPSIINNTTYKLIKRDVYVTDDVAGNPLGKLFWHIAKANWNTVNGFVHTTSITDLRTSTMSDEEFQDVINQKINLVVVGGGTIGVDTDGDTLHWSSNFTVLNPSGPEQQINSNSGIVVVDGGCVAYFMDLVSGGIISVGNLSVTSTTSGTTITFSGSPDLSQVRKGNILQIGSSIAEILTIDNVSKSVTVSSSISGTGSGTIYRDSFAPNTVPIETDVFILAVRVGSIFKVANVLELSAGTSNTIYDERILYPAGLIANTNITLPNNSRNGSKSQYYSASAGNLSVYINQLLKTQGIDWVAIDSQTIQINYALSNDTEVHFRIESLPSGSVGGGSGASGSLQAAYNIGNIITVISGTPVTINGPSGQKLLVVNGDMTVTGVIDPTGLQLSPQSSNPLISGQAGVWVNSSGELMHETGTSSQNITQVIQSVMDGTSNLSVSINYINNTGNTIIKGTAVYSPAPGAVNPGSGYSSAQANIIGIAAENIIPSASGAITLFGKITNITGFPQNTRVYLGTTGELVSTPPSILGGYPSGYIVVSLGIIENGNLLVNIQPIGIL